LLSSIQINSLFAPIISAKLLNLLDILYFTAKLEVGSKSSGKKRIAKPELKLKA
jgi:hypothetical protein